MLESTCELMSSLRIVLGRLHFVQAGLFGSSLFARPQRTAIAVSESAAHYLLSLCHRNLLQLLRTSDRSGANAVSGRRQDGGG